MIEFKDVSKSFNTLEVLKDFNIGFADKKVNTIIGPNGSGKTTILRLIAGLIAPDGGQILNVPDKISYIFQEERLLPFLTARKNIEFVLEGAYKDKPEREEVADKFLRLADLLKFADYYPAKLSGGMRQRLSIARAFAYPSELLLMDEPFKALDIKRMEELNAQIYELFTARPRTVIFVTHSINEALISADKIFVLGDSPLKIRKIFDIATDKKARDITSPESVKLNAKIIAAFR